MEVSDPIERDQPRWWVRLRSAAVLALLLTALGVAVATVIGVLAIGVAALFDQALG